MASSRRPSSRRDSKEATRQALLKGALRLLSRTSFDHLSLREVTREAGISPTAFYRHFDDMEELGLVLVEESFGTLRDMLRGARADPTLAANVIRNSVAVIALHVRDHAPHLRFIARERYGGVRRLRRAIKRELQLFADELAIDLARFPVLEAWPVEHRQMFAGILVETMVHTVAELLEANEEEAQQILAMTERQMRLVLVGVTQWDPARSQQRPPVPVAEITT
jgi:AcrR family transcriptional regulator